MFVRLGGLGASSPSKQQYLAQLDSSYSKYISSGMCPFNALTLAAQDVMGNAAQTPESNGALEEFVGSKSRDAMTVPCDGSSVAIQAPNAGASPTLPRIRPGGTVRLPAQGGQPPPRMIDVPVPVVRDNTPIFIGIGIVALATIALYAKYGDRS